MNNSTDISHLEQLIDEWQDSLYALAFFRIGDEGAAQDVVQEAFIRYYREQQRTTIVNAKAWLYRTTLNLATDHLRRRPPIRAVPLAAALGKAEVAREMADMVLGGRLDELNADKGQMLLAFDALKTEYCKTENFDSRTGTTLVMTLYALCSHIGNLMKGYPQTNDPNLRELLRSQLDDMIRFTNHSSDIGRTHIGYLQLAKKALQ